ncbi:hypothetical protein Dimus_004684 [Dionaea muscipula]
MAGQARSLTYYDFMGVGSESDYVPLPALELELVTPPSPTPTDRENIWPIKRVLTAIEVHDDVLYMEKDAFQTYILPFMPQAQRNKLAKGLIADIAVKDERCVFCLTKLYVYEGYYVLTKYRSQTFIRSRELVAGQTLWLRWINGYMEFKVVG